MNNKKYNPPQKLSSNARFKSIEDYSKELEWKESCYALVSDLHQGKMNFKEKTEKQNS